MKLNKKEEIPVIKNRPILVVGSSNTDMIISVTEFPKPGETIIGNSFLMDFGGKGANQAVAAARLGGDVTFIAKVGKDVFGTETLKKLRSENIETAFIEVDENKSSGVALITVDQHAENHIVVASGSNEELKYNDNQLLESLITEETIVLMQLEIPIETIARTCKVAREKHAFIIINPAPAKPLTKEILAEIDIITPNQEEAKHLSGIEITDENSAFQAAKIIHALGPKTVIITMGEKGAFVLDQEISQMIPGHKVLPVDTTGAGDVFNGAIAVGLSQGKNILESIKLGCKASSIAVTRSGAQSAIPYFNEL